jgi:hypothetical protein
MDERYNTLIDASCASYNECWWDIIEDDPIKGQRYTVLMIGLNKIKIHETKQHKDDTIEKRVEILQ